MQFLPPYSVRKVAEAEPLLREARQVDPEQPNAYKNLGLCLWGLERHVEAAVCFIDANDDVLPHSIDAYQGLT